MRHCIRKSCCINKECRTHNLKKSNTINKHFVTFFLQVHRGMNYPKLLGILNDIPKQHVNHLIYMIFFIRSPRGGRGERMLGRFCYQWLLINHPEIMTQNLSNISEYGRWDDIFFYFFCFLAHSS